MANDPHEICNVNFSCGSHKSGADVMEVHEGVCERACRPPNVFRVVDTAPIRNVMESTNSAVHSHGSNPTKLG